MPLSFSQSLITIAALILGTLLTRFLPFVLFSDSSKTPAIITYLGKVLPFAAMGMLIVYCLKDVRLFSTPHGMPEFIAIACIVFLHLRLRNTLLSIGAGTVLYMVLIQLVF